MEIYQDASSAHTPGRQLRSSRKPLTPHNHQTPMQAFRQSLKDAASSANATSAKKRKKKSVLFQASVGVDKENKDSMSTTPSSAQSFRRSLRGNAAQAGKGSKLLGARRLTSLSTKDGPSSLALGSPKRVIPRTPNSLLQSELGVDDSMDDDSFLVSPPPGALWNQLDPSSTRLVVVSPQVASQIHQTISAKKQTRASPLFSPPLQPRILPTDSTEQTKPPASRLTSQSKGQWFSLEQLPDSSPAANDFDDVTPKGSTRVDLSSAFSSTKNGTSTTKKKTPPPHLLERLGRSTKSSQIEKDLPPQKKRNGLSMDFSEIFSATNHNEPPTPAVKIFTPKETTERKGNGLMDYTHLFSDSKAKKRLPPPKLVERLRNPIRKSTPATKRSDLGQGGPTGMESSCSLEQESSIKKPAFEKEAAKIESDSEVKNKVRVQNVETVSSSNSIKPRKRSPRANQKNPKEESPVSFNTERGGEEVSTSQSTLEKKENGLMDYSHMFSDSMNAAPPSDLEKRLQQPRTSRTAQSKIQSKTPKKAALVPGLTKKSAQDGPSLRTESATSRPGLPRIGNKKSKKERACTGGSPQRTVRSSKESARSSSLVRKPGKYGVMATPSSRIFNSLATPSSRKAATPRALKDDTVDEYTLHPPEDDDFLGTADIADPASPSCSGLRMLLIHRRLAQSRKRASEVFYGDRMQNVKNTIHHEIARGRLAIRSDRDVYYDLSLRRQITKLLQSYTTPWLRLGLEVMFGEAIAVENSVQNSTMTPFSRFRRTLGTFIVDRVLSDSAVLKKYTKGKCKIPSGRFEKQFRSEMRSLIVYRIMILIMFLDEAKRVHVLDKVPRLFAKESEVKSSKEVLLSFCRACLSAEGDFIKHLSRIGLKVSYKQDPVDELDYYVTNLATDLRDGSSLTRVTEIITHRPTKSLMTRLRLPSISRLQKLYNLNLALSSLRESGIMVADDVNAHHIVDGHRDMVLKVMWSLIAHCCMEKLLEGDLVEKEIQNVLRSNQARRKVQGLLEKELKTGEEERTSGDSSAENVLKSLLFRWCQAVCSSFGITLNDFTTSFADGRALCLLVHYYHPSVIGRDEILPTTSDNVEGLPEDQAIQNERDNSKLASRRASELGGIPKMIPCCDSKNPPNERSMLLCLTYLCSRLMESSKEIFATILLQQAYRKYREKVLHEKKQEAASAIFSFWVKNKGNYYSSQKQCYQRAVALIEVFVLANRSGLRRMKIARIEKETRSSAAKTIQRLFRGGKDREKYYGLRKHLHASITIQCFFRVVIAKHVKLDLLQNREAALCLQRTWRGFLQSQRYHVAIDSAIVLQRFGRGIVVKARIQREEAAAIRIQEAWWTFVDTWQMNWSATKIQSAWRGFSARLALEQQLREEEKVCEEAAIVIQSAWRGFAAQVQFQLHLLDIISVQSLARKRIAIRRHHLVLTSVATLQCAARCWLARLKLQTKLREMNAVITCQCAIRCWLSKSELTTRRRLWRSATNIQKGWRMCRDRGSYQILSASAVSIQALIRGHLDRQKVDQWRQCARDIQLAWRSFSRGVLCQNAASTIQRTWRAFFCRKRYCRNIASVILVQKFWRGFTVRSNLEKKTFAATILQSCWRSFTGRMNYQLDLLEIIFVQNAVRRFLAKRESARRRKAIKAIQSASRRLLAVKATDTLRQQKIEKENADKAARRIQYRLMVGDIITVQSIVRRHLTIQSCQKKCNAAVKIQSFFRGHALRSSLQIYHYHASILQACFRGFVVRIAYTLDVLDVLTIQSLARRWLAQRLAKRRQSLIPKIQSVARRWISTRRVSDLRVIKKRQQTESTMACRIQALCKGYKTRKTLSMLNKNATCIQKTWRGFIARSRFTAKRKHATAIQSVIRMWLAARFISMQNGSARKIQSRVRQRNANRRVAFLKAARARKHREQTSCITIQCVWRGHRDRQIAGEHAAARKIQKTWRCFVTHVDFLVQVMSVLAIQANVRRLLASRTFQERMRREKNAAIVIQSSLRSWFARNVFSVKKYAATAIQRVTRGFLTRLNFEIEHFAATEIQRAWRGFDQYVEYAYIVFAVVKIQAHIRRCLAKKEYERLELKAWADELYLNKKASILQEAYRGYSSRRKLSRAATTIQKTFREYLAQWRASMLSRATIRLQAAFRGQAIRRKRSKTVANISRRVLRAKRRAMQNPKQRLGYRTSSALNVLESSTSLAEIMEAVKTLESATRLSLKCCEVFTGTQAAKILLDLIRACNRSLPHVELVHWILLTLENVGQHAQLLHCFSNCTSAEVFLDKVQMFRDKDGIFCLSVSLLRRIVYTNQDVLVSSFLISSDALDACPYVRVPPYRTSVEHMNI
eukprot:scaffold381_cov138-Cylindrotheca_fusiformis.AAC.3